MALSHAASTSSMLVPRRPSSKSVPQLGRNNGVPQPVQCRAASASVDAALPVDTGKITRMRLKALEDCELAVSIYPNFAYNASSGGGWASAKPIPGQPGKLAVTFDPQGVHIPSLNWQTATLFKIPIPPPLNIAISTQRLEGTVCTLSGQVELEFDAEFVFTAGPLYKAPPLIVKTKLTTGHSQGKRRQGTGQPFGNNFRGRLAGTAQVEKTGDAFMDTFLILPNDALALMSAELEFE